MVIDPVDWERIMIIQLSINSCIFFLLNCDTFVLVVDFVWSPVFCSVSVNV